MISTLIRIKKTPFAKPLKVSILPNPYGNFWLDGHLLARAAKRPTARATQSKNMCMLSLSRPRESVT